MMGTGHGLYDFKPDDAYRFAREMHIETRQQRDELFFKECVYCHGNGKGNNWSFSINLKTGVFKCFRASCNAVGNMVTLAKDFDFSLGEFADTYYKPKRTFRPIMTVEKKITPKPPAIQYLEGRGISEQIANKYEITVQTEHSNVLVIPCRDANGDMWFVKYRKTDYDKERDRGKEWCEKDKKPILFGMYQCNLENKSLVITEGPIDALSVAEAGFENVVSVPTGANGFTWIPHCWDWMNHFTEIIVFGDCEKGHITLLDEISRRFQHLKIRHVREEDYKDCKDANEILQKHGKEQIAKCINNSVIIPISGIIDLADVEDVDVYDLEKLRTGITRLDSLLYGGLPFGGVTLVTGKTGNGKSALSSQILARAIHQGYTCFAYSGELPNYLFKAWLDFQIAGRKHVVEYTNQWGDRRLNVSKTNRALIADWYRGKCYLYDNRIVDDDEQKTLTEYTEKAITQYGARVILIDNLMTGLDLEKIDSYDKYDKQSNFIKKFTRIALKYNVLIIMVAHKRKNNFSDSENDEIAGSSDIANLGMLTLTYEKGKKIREDQRLLKVSKNRLFGKLELEGFVMNYDEKSKRIFGDRDDIDFDYGWDENTFDPISFMNQLDVEEIPFVN